MKRCATCDRTYTDQNLQFCTEDGTPLTEVEADDDTTVVSPRNQEATDWSAVGYQPPRAYVPPGAEAKRRRAWPWILGIAAAFILGIVAISIAAFLLAPRLIRQAEQSGRNVNQAENPTRPPTTNSNPAETNSNANVDSVQHGDTPPPSDHDQVLAQLTNIENEWTVANLNADKKKLDQILADDFVGQVDGQLQSKADYIRTIQRATGVQKWEFSDLKLTLTGDRATLRGTIKYFVEDRSPAFAFTDRFVWRDGRWQATGAEIAPQNDSEVDL